MKAPRTSLVTQACTDESVRMRANPERHFQYVGGNLRGITRQSCCHEAEHLLDVTARLPPTTC